MALNNLRVVYNNLADLSTTSVTASSTQSGSSLTNLKLDTKGLVWRSGINTASATSVTAVLSIDLGTATSVNSIILPYTNLTSSTATVAVTGYSAAPTLGGTIAAPTITPSGTGAIAYAATDTIPINAVGGTVTYATVTTNCCPWNSLSLSAWGTNPAAANTYAYGGGTAAVVWLTPSINSRYLTIHITDNFASKTNSYIEVSRLILGSYWSPTYNTGYGMTATQHDLSAHDRTESGDLITQRGPRFNSLSFQCDFLTPADRKELTKIMLGNGLPRPLFISLFPNNGTTSTLAEMERAHQIYGKLTTLPGISYRTLDMYNTQFDVEEV